MRDLHFGLAINDLGIKGLWLIVQLSISAVWSCLQVKTHGKNPTNGKNPLMVKIHMRDLHFGLAINDLGIKGLWLIVQLSVSAV